jgi:hypothetical protein
VTILIKLGSMVTILTTLGNQWAPIMAELEVGLSGRWTDCLRHNCALQCLPLIYMTMLHNSFKNVGTDLELELGN